MQRQGVLLSGAMTGAALPSERTVGQLAGKVVPWTEQRPRHHLSAAVKFWGAPTQASGLLPMATDQAATVRGGSSPVQPCVPTGYRIVPASSTSSTPSPITGTMASPRVHRQGA